MKPGAAAQNGPSSRDSHVRPQTRENPQLC